MIKRINYTKRKKIKRDSIIIELTRKDGKITSFSATIDLKSLNLQPDADVFIEPYYQTERMRFSMGKVKEVIDIDNQSLSLLARHDSIKFRILVVDNSEEIGQIIAYANRLHPSDEDDKDIYKHGLLPVRFIDLGRQTWRVAFGEEPVLEVNDKIPNPHGIAKKDLKFFFFVFPSVLKLILIHLFFVEKVIEYDEPVDEWHKNWLGFSKRFNSSEIPENNGENTEHIMEWIDNVVDGFCNSRSKDWKNFIRDFDGVAYVSD